MKHRLLLLAMSLILSAGMAQAQNIALGVLDDFNDNTVQGWRHGGLSPNPPVTMPGGGPDDSPYLENTSSGGFGPGSKHLIFNNDARWTGDYIEAGVNKIRVNIINLGLAPLPIRFATFSVPPAGGAWECWASTDAHTVPADAVWRNYEFLLDASTMTQIGTNSFEDTLRNVVEVRLLSAAAPACVGDEIAATSGYDDVQSAADPDTDGDGHTDEFDNCQSIMNGGQIDTDRDGLGNICDADFSDDCLINFIDLNIMKQHFFTNDSSPDWDPDVDLNNDGAVNFIDLLVMQNLFFGPPGPSGTAHICEPGCGLRGTGLDPVQHFGVELFVRGSFNDWGHAPPYNLINFGGGVYRAQVEVATGQWELKIADALWTLEYDAPTRLLLDVPLILNGGIPDGSPDIFLELENNGCYNFRVEVVDSGVPPAQVELTVNRKH